MKEHSKPNLNAKVNPKDKKNENPNENWFKRVKGIIDVIDPGHHEHIIGLISELLYYHINYRNDPEVAITRIEKLIKFAKNKKNTTDFIQYILEISLHKEYSGRDSSNYFECLELLEKITPEKLDYNSLIIFGKIVTLTSKLSKFEREKLTGVMDFINPKIRIYFLEIFASTPYKDLVLKYATIYATLFEDYVEHMNDLKINFRYPGFWKELNLYVHPNDIYRIQAEFFNQIEELNDGKMLAHSIEYELDTFSPHLAEIISLSKDKPKTAEMLIRAIKVRMLNFISKQEKITEFISFLERLRNLPEHAKIHNLDLTDINVIYNAGELH